MKVGYNKEQEKVFKRDLEVKQNAFRTAKTYAEQFINVDATEFYRDFTQAFKTAFITKHRNDFPPIVSDDKMLELSGVELKRLIELQKVFNSINIELNPDTLEPTDEPDFGIYITGEKQLELYNQLKTICDNVNDFRKVSNIQPASFIQAFGGALTFDWSTATIQPNVAYIQMNRR
jgi:hypothetical protein